MTPPKKKDADGAAAAPRKKSATSKKAASRKTTARKASKTEGARAKARKSKGAETAPGAFWHSHSDESLAPAPMLAPVSDDLAEPNPELLASLPFDRERLAGLTRDQLAALADEVRQEELRRLGDAPSRRTIDWLMQSEKLASVGILTRGIAHEFNNLFTGVIGYCDFALSSDDPDIRRKALEVALAAARKASVIVKNLQTFARRRKTEVQPVDVVELLSRSLLLVETNLRLNKIKLWKRLRTVPTVRADPSDLEQVFLNLLTNAMQAIEGAGEIRATADTEGPWVVVTIRDNGCGIPPEIRTRIFEPFFSTKGVYGPGLVPGTGLGLSVVHGIIERIGGRLELESEIGKGTTFTVRLPASPDDRGKRKRRRDPIRSPDPDETLHDSLSGD